MEPHEHRLGVVVADVVFRRTVPAHLAHTGPTGIVQLAIVRPVRDERVHGLRVEIARKRAPPDAQRAQQRVPPLITSPTTPVQRQDGYRSQLKTRRLLRLVQPLVQAVNGRPAPAQRIECRRGHPRIHRLLSERIEPVPNFAATPEDLGETRCGGQLVPVPQECELQRGAFPISRSSV